PISAARGHYWAGRAAEKQGRSSEATRQYAAAAQFPMTFYGQVAAATLNPKATLELPSQRTSPSSRQAFKDQGLVQAHDLSLLLELRLRCRRQRQHPPLPTRTIQLHLRAVYALGLRVE
ncbi:MAG: hypothetical protein ACK55Z_24920, partial [bacterium]